MKNLFVTVIFHVLIWAIYLFLPNITMDQQFDWNHFVLRNRELVLLCVYFYFNIYWLIPRFLEKNKIGRYVIATLGCFIVFAVLQPAIDVVVFKYISFPKGDWLHDFLHRVIERGYRLSFRDVFRNVSQIVFFFAVGTGWKVYQRWRLEEKQKDQAQKERLAAELSLLKTQVSPHFLFNSLNSIYSLSVQKSENAPLAIVKLSELLRYMIYHASKSQVPLSEELSYIRNFIELQQIRLASDVSIVFDVQVKNKSVEIEPMLLIPIIENTFKHGVSYKEPSEIVIQLTDNNGCLNLHTSNHIFRKKKTENSGFGLENLKKRLNFRYPGLYRLEINEQGTEFVVDFSLKLKG